MDQSRDQFLAAAGFAADVHRCLAARQLVDVLAQVTHGHRVAEQPAINGVADAAGRGQAQGAGDQLPQAGEIDRFGQKVEGAGLEGIDRRLEAAVSGNHRHGYLRIALLDVLHQFQAGAIRQAHVGQAQVECLPAQQRMGFAKVTGTEGVEFHPSQGDFQEFADIRFVVDDEDFCRGLMFNFVSVREQR